MKLEMRFEPKSWLQGETISLIASLLAILAFIAGFTLFVRRGDMGTTTGISDVEPQSPRVTPASQSREQSQKPKDT